MKSSQIREVMDYINDLDSGVGTTELEWIDILDEMEEKYGENCKVTAKRLDKYFEEL